MGDAGPRGEPRGNATCGLQVRTGSSPAERGLPKGNATCGLHADRGESGHERTLTCDGSRRLNVLRQLHCPPACWAPGLSHVKDPTGCMGDPHSFSSVSAWPSMLTQRHRWLSGAARRAECCRAMATRLNQNGSQLIQAGLRKKRLNQWAPGVFRDFSLIQAESMRFSLKSSLSISFAAFSLYSPESLVSPKTHTRK